MEGNQAKLTSREESYFEHVRQAKAQGLTLKGYCERLGLNVRSLYGVRRELVRKGVVPRTLAPKTSKAERSQFVAIRVATPGASDAEAVCRVRHPSGWILECLAWPEAAWVSALMQGGGHVAA